MIKKWQLANLLYNDISEFDYSMKYTNSAGDEVELYSSDAFYDQILYKYTSWCITSPVFRDTETGDLIELARTVDGAITLFHAIYSDWRTEKLPGFAKLYEAFRAEYNPIWNVDGVTGVIIEDTHSGTDTITKRGTDTSNLSGSDKNTASGSDITTLSGQDVDTLSGSDTDRLSGSDVLRESGTDTTAHTGTVTDAKSITKDDTDYTGREIHHKTGDEIIGEESATFDSGSTMHPTKKTTTHYPDPEDTGARADITEFDHRTDSHTYEDSDTTTYGNSDSTTYGKSDTTTYGKTDTTTYGRKDTLQYGKVDTLQHGKVDTMQYGKQDQTTYNTTNTDTKDLKDQHIEMQIRQGNIGVTMTQQLIEAQQRITGLDSLIDYMISDFVHNNCII